MPTLKSDRKPTYTELEQRLDQLELEVEAYKEAYHQVLDQLDAATSPANSLTEETNDTRRT